MKRKPLIFLMILADAHRRQDESLVILSGVRSTQSKDLQFISASTNLIPLH